MNTLSDDLTQPASFGYLLKFHRTSNNMSKAGLANRLDLPLHIIYKLEDGKTIPPPTVIDRIADILQLSTKEYELLLKSAEYYAKYYTDTSIPFTVRPNMDTEIHPPSFAEYLLYYVPMDKNTRNNVIGDLRENFHIIYHRYGQKKAVIWYYSQIINSFQPFIMHKIQQLIKLGAIGWLGSWIRHLIP